MPLRLVQWELLLVSHPDRDYVDYILRGSYQGVFPDWFQGIRVSIFRSQEHAFSDGESTREGFQIGFKASGSVSSVRKNMHSAMENPQVVSAYIAEERKRGFLLGPFEKAEVHLNRFGMIPKSGQPGKWRLIVDLSHTEGGSVNDSIQPELCSLQYVHMDHVVGKLTELGPGAKMAKLDIRSAYQIVPVHPQDRQCLA